MLMELGFLKRVRESPLWPRVGVVFGTSSGALSGAMAALDRLDELEEFMLALQPDQTFRPNRLWRLPFLGLHEYALPATIEGWFARLDGIAEQLVASPIELVVLATDLTDDHERPESGYELVYSARTTPPPILARAIVASAAVPALVLPLQVGDRVATDGSWVRNFPLGHAYDRPDVELIVAFRYLPRYPRMTTDALVPFKRRLQRFGRLPPIRAFLSELEEAEARAERGEPAHLADLIVRLARVAILRNTELEERVAEERDASLHASDRCEKTFSRSSPATTHYGRRSPGGSPRRTSRSAVTGSCRGSPCAEASRTRDSIPASARARAGPRRTSAA